jgi:hypothetical protein
MREAYARILSRKRNRTPSTKTIVEAMLNMKMKDMLITAVV